MMQIYDPSNLARRRWRIAFNHILASIRLCNIEGSEGIREIGRFFTFLEQLERTTGISKIFQHEIGALLPTREVEATIIDLYQAERQALITKQMNHIRLTDGSIRPINERDDTTFASIQTIPAHTQTYQFFAHGPDLSTYPLPNNFLHRLKTTPFPKTSNITFHLTTSKILRFQTAHSQEQYDVIYYGEQHHWFQSMYTIQTKNLTYKIKLAFLNFREDESDNSLPYNKFYLPYIDGISVQNIQLITQHAKGADFFGVDMRVLDNNSIEGSSTDLTLIVADIYLPDEKNRLLAFQGRLGHQIHYQNTYIVSNSSQLIRAIIWTKVKEATDQGSFEVQWRKNKENPSTLDYVMDPYMADLSFYKRRIGQWKSGYFIGLFLDKLQKNSEVDFRWLGPISCVPSSKLDFQDSEDQLEIEVDGEIISYKHKLPYITLASFFFFIILTILAVVCLVLFTDSSVADIIQATGVLLLSGAIGISGLIHTLQYGAWPLDYALRGRGVARSFDKLRRTVADDVKIFKELIHREKLRGVLSPTGSSFIPHVSFGSENIANWFRLQTAVDAGAEIRLTRNGTVSYKATSSTSTGRIRGSVENKVLVYAVDVRNEDNNPTIWQFKKPDDNTRIG